MLCNGWNDPITLDVGLPWAPGYREPWVVADGNHRLYAAILRGDSHILAVLGGCITTAYRLFTPQEITDADRN